MRRLSILALAIWPFAAHADEPARDALKGFRIAWKTGFTYHAPRSNADAVSDIDRQQQEFTLVFSQHIGVGVPLGPFVLSIGGNVPAYFFDANTTIGLLGELELHLPIRWFSPYVLASGGGALGFAAPCPVAMMNPNDTPHATPPCGVNGYGVFRGGGGLTVFPASFIGLGFQAAYVRFNTSQMVELVWPIELRF